MLSAPSLPGNIAPVKLGARQHQLEGVYIRNLVREIGNILEGFTPDARGGVDGTQGSIYR